MKVGKLKCREIDERAIVIDNGSGMSKAGWEGDDCPRVILPTIVGKPKYKEIMVGMGQKASYIGDEAQTMRGMLKIHQPIKHGVIVDWEKMEEVWNHIFNNELRIDSEDHALLITETPQNPKRNKETMMEIMFETFSVPKIYVATQGVLSLYASGRTKGVVLDVGEGVTSSIAVYEGFLINHATHRSEIAGCDITDYLGRLMMQRHYSFTSTAEREIVRDMKESLATILPIYHHLITKSSSSSLNRNDNNNNNSDVNYNEWYDTYYDVKTYKLPDGQIIEVGSERYQCAEILFHPSYIGGEDGGKGIHQMIFQTIMNVDIDLRCELMKNIIISGGTTMISGLKERLNDELLDLIKKQKRDMESKRNSLNIIAPPERKYSTWIGGSILASLSSFNNFWISKSTFNEQRGNSIIASK